jgi:hypothetical protein
MDDLLDYSRASSLTLAADFSILVRAGDGGGKAMREKYSP